MSTKHDSLGHRPVSLAKPRLVLYSEPWFLQICLDSFNLFFFSLLKKKKNKIKALSKQQWSNDLWHVHWRQPFPIGLVTNTAKITTHGYKIYPNIWGILCMCMSRSVVGGNFDTFKDAECFHRFAHFQHFWSNSSTSNELFNSGLLIRTAPFTSTTVSRWFSEVKKKKNPESKPPPQVRHSGRKNKPWAGPGSQGGTIQLPFVYNVITYPDITDDATKPINSSL